MLYVTGMHLKDITNTFFSFAFECGSPERLLLLFKDFCGSPIVDRVDSVEMTELTDRLVTKQTGPVANFVSDNLMC